MAIAIGYNVKKAEEVMASISSAFTNLGIYTAEQWESVVKSLQDNWIGEDEQDFEKKLADRICKLYDNAYQLANGSIDTIANLVDAWYQFQKNNTIDGTAYEAKRSGGTNTAQKPKIKANSQIVKAKSRNFAKDQDRGLRDASSKASIQGSVETFVNEVKNKTKGLFEEIQTNNAFFGDQTTAIKGYVDKCGDAIGQVTVAVKDMYDALEVLANQSYVNASSDISQEFSTASTNVEQSLNELGSSRWQ